MQATIFQMSFDMPIKDHIKVFSETHMSDSEAGITKERHSELHAADANNSLGCC